MKTKLLFIAIIGLLSIMAYGFGKAYFNVKKDNNRLKNTLIASNEQISYYETENGNLAARNSILQLNYNELKNTFPEILSEIKNLKIKLRSVSSYSQTAIEQEKVITTILRDSMILDTIPARTFYYKDDFYTVKGLAINDTQKVEINSRDSIIQVVYKGKRYKPLLWILSKRKLEQVISCKNPNSKITYSKYIEFEKRK